MEFETAAVIGLGLIGGSVARDLAAAGVTVRAYDADPMQLEAAVSDGDREAAVAELTRCREEIERIDNEIIALLARRLTLGKRTGDLKRAAGMPILDPTREAAVIRRVTERARDAGLPPEAAREVFWQIVGMSRRAQEPSLGGASSGGAERQSEER